MANETNISFTEDINPQKIVNNIISDRYSLNAAAATSSTGSSSTTSSSTGGQGGGGKQGTPGYAPLPSGWSSASPKYSGTTTTTTTSTGGGGGGGGGGATVQPTQPTQPATTTKVVVPEGGADLRAASYAATQSKTYIEPLKTASTGTWTQIGSSSTGTPIWQKTGTTERIAATTPPGTYIKTESVVDAATKYFKGEPGTAVTVKTPTGTETIYGGTEGHLMGTLPSTRVQTWSPSGVKIGDTERVFISQPTASGEHWLYPQEALKRTDLTEAQKTEAQTKLESMYYTKPQFLTTEQAKAITTGKISTQQALMGILPPEPKITTTTSTTIPSTQVMPGKQTESTSVVPSKNLESQINVDSKRIAELNSMINNYKMTGELQRDEKTRKDLENRREQLSIVLSKKYPGADINKILTPITGTVESGTGVSIFLGKTNPGEISKDIITSLTIDYDKMILQGTIPYKGETKTTPFQSLIDTGRKIITTAEQVKQISGVKPKEETVQLAPAQTSPFISGINTITDFGLKTIAKTAAPVLVAFENKRQLEDRIKSLKEEEQKQERQRYWDTREKDYMNNVNNFKNTGESVKVTSNNPDTIMFLNNVLEIYNKKLSEGRLTVDDNEYIASLVKDLPGTNDIKLADMPVGFAQTITQPLTTISTKDGPLTISLWAPGDTTKVETKPREPEQVKIGPVSFQWRSPWSSVSSIQQKLYNREEGLKQETSGGFDSAISVLEGLKSQIKTSGDDIVKVSDNFIDYQNQYRAQEESLLGTGMRLAELQNELRQKESLYNITKNPEYKLQVDALRQEVNIAYDRNLNKPVQPKEVITQEDIDSLKASYGELQARHQTLLDLTDKYNVINNEIVKRATNLNWMAESYNRGGKAIASDNTIAYVNSLLKEQSDNSRFLSIPWAAANLGGIGMGFVQSAIDMTRAVGASGYQLRRGLESGQPLASTILQSLPGVAQVKSTYDWQTPKQFRSVDIGIPSGLVTAGLLLGPAALAQTRGAAVRAISSGLQPAEEVAKRATWAKLAGIGIGAGFLVVPEALEVMGGKETVKGALYDVLQRGAVMAYLATGATTSYKTAMRSRIKDLQEEIADATKNIRIDTNTRGGTIDITQKTESGQTVTKVGTGELVQKIEPTDIVLQDSKLNLQIKGHISPTITTTTQAGEGAETLGRRVGGPMWFDVRITSLKGEPLTEWMPFGKVDIASDIVAKTVGVGQVQEYSSGTAGIKTANNKYYISKVVEETPIQQLGIDKMPGKDINKFYDYIKSTPEGKQLPITLDQFKEYIKYLRTTSVGTPTEVSKDAYTTFIKGADIENVIIKASDAGKLKDIVSETMRLGGPNILEKGSVLTLKNYGFNIIDVKTGKQIGETITNYGQINPNYISKIESGAYKVETILPESVDISNYPIRVTTSTGKPIITFRNAEQYETYAYSDSDFIKKIQSGEYIAEPIKPTTFYGKSISIGDIMPPGPSSLDFTSRTGTTPSTGTISGTTPSSGKIYNVVYDKYTGDTKGIFDVKIQQIPPEYSSSRYNIVTKAQNELTTQEINQAVAQTGSKSVPFMSTADREVAAFTKSGRGQVYMTQEQPQNIVTQEANYLGDLTQTATSGLITVAKTLPVSAVVSASSIIPVTLSGVASRQVSEVQPASKTLSVSRTLTETMPVTSTLLSQLSGITPTTEVIPDTGIKPLVTTIPDVTQITSPTTLPDYIPEIVPPTTIVPTIPPPVIPPIIPPFVPLPLSLLNRGEDSLYGRQRGMREWLVTNPIRDLEGEYLAGISKKQIGEPWMAPKPISELQQDVFSKFKKTMIKPNNNKVYKWGAYKEKFKNYNFKNKNIIKNTKIGKKISFRFPKLNLRL